MKIWSSGCCAAVEIVHTLVHFMDYSPSVHPYGLPKKMCTP